MTLTAEQCTRGLPVRMNTDALATYGVPQGSAGLVNRQDSGDVLVDWTREGDSAISLWTYAHDLVHADPAQITDLEVYKNFAAREFWKAKAANGWCSSAEYLANTMGLHDYLPSTVWVDVTVREKVERWPGESDTTVNNRARTQVQTKDRLRVRDYATVETATATTQGTDEFVPVEGETLDAFKARIAAGALSGAKRFGVTGVPEFLRAIGIDPDAVEVPTTIYATVRVQVPVPNGQTPAEFGRGLFALGLADLPGVTVSDVWGE